jgi:hypothetical protein
MASTSGWRAEEPWRKHEVHEGLHTNTAVAGDFTKDGKPDIISNSGSKTRLFVAPLWQEVVLAEGNGHDFIHSEFFDVDGDGVIIPNNNNLNVNSPGFTADFWMEGIKNQPDSLAAVFEKSHGFVDATGWAFQIDPTSGAMRFAVGDGGGFG